jgi:hypothetical protein
MTKKRKLSFVTNWLKNYHLSCLKSTNDESALVSYDVWKQWEKPDQIEENKVHRKHHADLVSRYDVVHLLT